MGLLRLIRQRADRNRAGGGLLHRHPGFDRRAFGGRGGRADHRGGGQDAAPGLPLGGSGDRRIAWLGNLFLFRAAYYGGRKFAREAAPDGRRAKFQRWFHRYGLLTVFIPAVTPFVPLPLKVFVISAGAMHTPLRRFLAVVLLARVIRYFGEAYLGIRLGQDAQGFLRDQHVEHRGDLSRARAGPGSIDQVAGPASSGGVKRAAVDAQSGNAGGDRRRTRRGCASCCSVSAGSFPGLR